MKVLCGLLDIEIQARWFSLGQQLLFGGRELLVREHPGSVELGQLLQLRVQVVGGRGRRGPLLGLRVGEALLVRLLLLSGLLLCKRLLLHGLTLVLRA